MRGLLYRSPLFYTYMNKLKLGQHENARFKIAASYISEGDSVCDICSGLGLLREYIPAACQYFSVEKSPQFSKILAQKGVLNYPLNVELEDISAVCRADVVVMIVSFYSFSCRARHRLLEDLKKCAYKKVLILEESYSCSNSSNKLHWWIKISKMIGNKIMGYLTEIDYMTRCKLLTARKIKEEFSKHGYHYFEYYPSLILGIYEKK